MQPINFDAFISKQFSTKIYLRLFNKIIKCICEAERYVQKAKPSTRYCERSEQIEFLKNFYTNYKGDLQNA